MCRRSSGGSFVRSGEVWIVVVFVGVDPASGLRWFGWVRRYRESDARGVLMERALSWCGFWGDDGRCWGSLAESLALSLYLCVGLDVGVMAMVVQAVFGFG